MTEKKILESAVFWRILEESGSINESRGMRMETFSSAEASLVTFSKTHSYGEYIFDWGWADAYKKSGLAYYPKLTSMVPFTPATASHFRGSESHWEELLRQHDERLLDHSSAHFLFTTPDEQNFLGERGYLLRDSFQYHFFNEGYENFEHFLRHLKTKKAKNLRSERVFPGLKIERLTGADLKPPHALEMFQFYLATTQEKNAIPYLTQEFFELLFRNLPENVLYVRAIKDEGTVAGALYYFDQHRLYGRYWGAFEGIRNLHFELCYYQGIDFCLERKLEVFEAGAQGEHKIARGFRPVFTRSAHKIRHPGFAKAIAEFIEREKEQVRLTIDDLCQYLPFK